MTRPLGSRASRGSPRLPARLPVLHARRHNVSGHKKAMISIFFGALVVAGLFTFLPGRIMHAVVFGP